MDSLFEIKRSGAFATIRVTGIKGDEYLADSDVQTAIKQYSYANSVSVNVIEFIKYNQRNAPVPFSVIVSHEMDNIDISDIYLAEDGLVRVSHIILPTNEWLDTISNLDSAQLTNSYSDLCIYDHTDQKIKLVNPDKTLIKELTAEELLLMDYSAFTGANKVTTVVRADKNTFTYDRLNKCFANICNDLFAVLPANCQRQTEKYKQQIYIRDLVWSAINVIRFNLDFGQLHVAQQLLEELTECAGICKPENINSNTSGCGCSR